MGNEVWRGEVVTQHAAGLTEREVTVRSPKGSISAPPPVGATVAVVGLADYYALEKAERERDQAREENERLVDEADEAREDVWRLREVSGYVPCPRCRATGWVEIMVGGDPDQCMLRPSDPAPPDEAECRERLDVGTELAAFLAEPDAVTALWHFCRALKAESDQSAAGALDGGERDED